MKGQWLGNYTGGNVTGEIMVNIDLVNYCYDVTIYVQPSKSVDGILVPGSVIQYRTNDTSVSHEVTADIHPIDPETNAKSRWENLARRFDSRVNHASTAYIKLRLTTDGRLDMMVGTDHIFDYAVSLSRQDIFRPSDISTTQLSWKEFKDYVGRFIHDPAVLFRGQRGEWRLSTTFHRSGRSRIDAYMNDDVQQLHRRLSALTSHYFDISQPSQNGAFLNLLQHHGYPTPLLDWSYSPYVAAFFAFRGVPAGYSEEENVRIYVFNSGQWKNNQLTTLHAHPPYAHLSVAEFIALENQRLVPQQAITTMTNVADIESFIQDKERHDKTQYLDAIELAADQRDIAMNDLRLMGITAGSMFPGVDGVCEEMRERNFS